MSIYIKASAGSGELRLYRCTDWDGPAFSRLAGLDAGWNASITIFHSPETLAEDLNEMFEEEIPGSWQDISEWGAAQDETTVVSGTMAYCVQNLETWVKGEL